MNDEQCVPEISGLSDARALLLTSAVMPILRYWVAVGAIGLASACSSTGDPTQPLPAAWAPQPSTPVPGSIPSPSPSASVRPSSPAITSSQVPAPPASSPVVSCTSQDLTAAFDQKNDPSRKSVVGGYALATPVALTNVSARPCTLAGWVGLTLFGPYPVACNYPNDPPGCGQEQTGDPMWRTKQTQLKIGQVRTLMLRPGDHIPFSILWNPDGDIGCFGMMQGPDKAEIRVPGDDRPIAVKPPPPIFP
jgi:hypothetical protein